MVDEREISREEAISDLEEGLKQAEEISNGTDLVAVEKQMTHFITQSLNKIDDYQKKGLLEAGDANKMRMRYVQIERSFYEKHNEIVPTPLNEIDL